MIVYTAIFGNHDTLKEPTVVTKGWRYIVYTDQDFKSNIWEIRKRTLQNSFTNDPRLLARYYKICFHKHDVDIHNMWIDGSFQITCDLNEWWSKYFKTAITCIKHPIRDCIYEEAQVCIDQKRGDSKIIQQQVDSYKKEIVAHSGLIQSGILMREKCDTINTLCEKWFEEIQKYSLRDQLSFNYVFKDHKVNFINDFVYQQNNYFKFTKHNKK